ncbi:MAG: hypothetical protein ACKN9E_17605 [Microcystaceae cyanobacterium]
MSFGVISEGEERQVEIVNSTKISVMQIAHIVLLAVMITTLTSQLLSNL